jgi:hypothetical protein
VPFFEGMLRSTRPGLDHYWREVSYGEINLEGSKVFDWKFLPQPISYYTMTVNIGGAPQPRAIIERIREDCLAEHASVDFTKFRGIAYIYDRKIDGIGRGGPQELLLDNVTRKWGQVWLEAENPGPITNSNALMAQNRMAHEMGHGFGDVGLNHSSGPSTNAYASGWDVMSGGRDCYDAPPGGKESQPDFPFGCIGTHTIATHKDYLGWIPADRKFTLTPGKRAIVPLARLAQPGSSGDLMVQIPIQGSSTKFYTVELRQNLTQNDGRKVTYDDGTPAGFSGAVIIHKVDYALKDRNAQVVDADNNGDVNDEGAMWKPGETFTDPANSVMIQVDSINRDAGTAVVTVDNRPVITIADVTVSEPSAPASTAQASFTVKLSNASSQNMGLDYFTTAGTATKDVDYVHAENHLSIPAGATTATITVNVKLDTLKEQSETFFVNLKNPIGASLGDTQAKGTILDRPPAGPPMPTPVPCPPPGTNCQEP